MCSHNSAQFCCKLLNAENATRKAKMQCMGKNVYGNKLSPLYLRTLWRYTNAVIIIIIMNCNHQTEIIVTNMTITNWNYFSRK